MQYCYRYWAWTTEIRDSEAELMRDLQLWHCEIERKGDSITVWVPESALALFQIKYPTMNPYPVFDRY
jgi:hypothetical protein